MYQIPSIKKIFVLALMLLSLSSVGQSPSNPAIKEFGTIYDMKDVVKPDPVMEYKIVIDLKAPVSDPKQINPGLNNVARMLNLHMTGGIPKENIKVAVAIHGGATSTILNNEGYQKKHGADNPNLKLINQLRNAGVELFVCGQSLIARGYDRKNVNPEVEIALSMLTVVTEKMMNGYGLLVFQ